MELRAAAPARARALRSFMTLAAPADGQILRDLTRDFGKTVIAVTHDLTFAGAADRRIGIVDGRIDPDWQA